MKKIHTCKDVIAMRFKNLACPYSFTSTINLPHPHVQTTYHCLLWDNLMKFQYMPSDIQIHGNKKCSSADALACPIYLLPNNTLKEY